MSHGSLGVPVHVPRYGTAGLCSRLPLVNKTTNRDRAGKGLVKGLALYVTGRPFQRASARRPVTGPEHPPHAATVPLSPGGSAAPQYGLAGRQGRGGGRITWQAYKAVLNTTSHASATCRGHCCMAARGGPRQPLRSRVARLSAQIVLALDVGCSPGVKRFVRVSSGNSMLEDLVRSMCLGP